MLGIPEKWKSVRAEEYKRLSNLLGNEAALIHVQGARGSGKSCLLSDICRERATVVIDANICGSVVGVMSSILRRLSLMKGRIAAFPESPESETELKELSEVKKEVSVDTPDDPSENLYEGIVKQRRKAAEIATSKLAAGPRRMGRPSKRKIVDRFIDDDDSDSDGGETDREGSGEDDDKDRVGKENNVCLDARIVKILHRAQEQRVRGPSAFVQKLERVILGNGQRTVLILDNIDAILSPEDFDLDSTSAKTTGSDFLRVLTRLDEYLSIPSQLSIVLVTSRMLPTDVAGRCAGVHLHAYTKSECFEIISRNDERFDSFLTTALAVLYPAYSGNFVVLRDTVNRLFESSVINEASRSALCAKAKLVCVEELNKTFGGGDDMISFDQQLREKMRISNWTKWLSKTSKLVLIAGYLAAHNPPNQDKILFRTVGQGRPVGRKKTISATTFKRNRLNADSIHIRAPVPFNLNRLLMIYRYVSGTWEEDSECDSGYLFQRTVRELVQHGIFKTGSDDWLKSGGVKLNCHAPLDLVQAIAEEANIKLDEVLYG